MSLSVGTKARKKQLSSAKSSAAAQDNDRKFERALLALENACLRILEGQFPVRPDDTERRYWQQKFKNIATPVSLALAEYKGPRRFHYHYRHRADDESVLHPVLEPTPVEMLSQVCKYALRECRKDLVGIQDAALNRARNAFEAALHNFLMRYREYQDRLGK